MQQSECGSLICLTAKGGKRVSMMSTDTVDIHIHVDKDTALRNRLKMLTDW